MCPQDRCDTGLRQSDSDILQLGRENTRSDQVYSDILQLGMENTCQMICYTLQLDIQNSGYDLSDLDVFM